MTQTALATARFWCSLGPNGDPRGRKNAGEHAGGRMVWVLEGGYDLGALAASVAATLEILATEPGTAAER